MAPHDPSSARRAGVLVWGVVTYAVHWAATLAFIAFLGNIAPITGIDADASGAWQARSIAIDLTLLAGFVITHWVMARDWWKQWWVRFVPVPVERATYVLIASLLVLALVRYWQRLPGVIWDVRDSPAGTAVYALYLGGWLLAIAATFPINHWDLFGIRQVWLYFRGIPYTPPVATPSVLYRLPHPIFVGYVIAVWSAPRMSAGHLLLTALLTTFVFVSVRLAR